MIKELGSKLTIRKVVDGNHKRAMSDMAKIANKKSDYLRQLIVRESHNYSTNVSQMGSKMLDLFLPANATPSSHLDQEVIQHKF